MKQTSNSDRNRASELFNDVVWGAQHDAFESELGRSLLQAWRVGACDENIAGMIRSKVQRLRTREAFGELNPFRKPRISQGKGILGRDTENQLIRFVIQWLNAGLLILGNTGSSKSNLVKFLILQIAEFIEGLWCTDLYKKEMRHLRPLLQRIGKDFIIVRSSQARVNILQSDQEDPSGHLADVLDTLRRILGLPSRAMSILRTVCHELYREFGIYSGNVSWPTLFDVFEKVRAASNLNAAAKDAILDRLGAFLVQLTPNVGAYRLAWKPSDLSKHFIDWEFSTAGEQVKSVILNYYLFSVLRNRVAKGGVNSPFRFWAIFEDGQRFFSSRAEQGREITPAEEIAGLIRGTGTGICITAQTTAGLPHGLLPNLASKIMCRLGSHGDYQALGADLGMNSQQIQWAKLNLRPGTAIVQLSEGPHRLPFVSYTPKLDIPAVVEDQEADASVAGLDDLPTVPAKEFNNWTLFPVNSISTRESEPEEMLSEIDLRFLQAVIDHVGKPSSFYSRVVGVSGKRAAQIRKRLVKEGYLREHKVATSQRGRNAIVLEPLEPAFVAVEKFGK